ncbi:hypothetical protein [uncultured Winogradskyella sp.]|uniref:hypothetical protein n=1 Tax=uncultured Winogradskyella sp. TaxID=395353 RepID=UPI0026089788|nr:hypothetical protein [uncultured Winogradskyella sp.]
MKHLFTTLCLCLSLLTFTCNAQDTLKLSDLEILNNTSWKGQLTYKDYQSGNPSSVDATLQIKIEGERITYNIQYTYEPKKNNKSSVKIKKNGTYYGNEKVVSNTLENGTRIFVTSYEGKDNGKKATMFITRQFSETSYKETKEVLLKNADERFIRNTYEFTKI